MLTCSWLGTGCLLEGDNCPFASHGTILAYFSEPQVAFLCIPVWPKRCQHISDNFFNYHYILKTVMNAGILWPALIHMSHLPEKIGFTDILMSSKRRLLRVPNKASRQVGPKRPKCNILSLKWSLTAYRF